MKILSFILNSTSELLTSLKFCSENLVVDTLVGRGDVHQIQHVVDVAFSIDKDLLFRRLLQ